DRFEVEAWQHVELTNTNRSRAYPTTQRHKHRAFVSHPVLKVQAIGPSLNDGYFPEAAGPLLEVGYFLVASLRSECFEKPGLVTMAEGIHAFPSRTRPLSPPAPMVLGPQGPGRVGRCQAICRLQ